MQKATRAAACAVSTALILALAGACDGPDLGQDRTNHPTPPDGKDPQNDGGTMLAPGATPFEPLLPDVYVPKVKNLLTGLAATDGEIKAVVADPNALRGLIDTWMALPQFETKMVDFFRNAFQQNNVDVDLLFTRSLGYEPSGFDRAIMARFNRAMMDSFAKTAWQLTKEGAPFTSVVTTNRTMMSTGLMNLYSFFDELYADDGGGWENRFTARHVTNHFTASADAHPSLAESADPSSPSFMTWNLSGTGCTAPYTYNLGDDNYGHWRFSRALERFLTGRLEGLPCGPNGNPEQVGAQFTDADWNDWRMVKLNKAAPADVTSPVFYDLAGLRTATSMNLHTRRIGYFGTLAFAANWPTNASNQARVIANQTLIVGIGRSIAPPDNGAPSPFPSTPSETAHASNPVCAGCHARLDPYKQFFRQSYSLYFGEQNDPAQINAQAGFAIDGVQASGQGVDAIAGILATHPRFPLAWALKLHFWANSLGASENDPEIIRIAAAFKTSNYDWKTLIRELFSSPLVTFAGPTQTTTDKGVIQSIARRNQLCALLSNRLGLPDVCGMTATAPTPSQSAINLRASMVPTDVYYRGYALPSLPTNPDLMFRRSVEATCQLVADQVVDNGTGSRYSSANADAAVTDMVTTLMGVPPGDARAASLTVILRDNLTAAKATAGVSATDALKATFTLACLSPTVTLVGY